MNLCLAIDPGLNAGYAVMTGPKERHLVLSGGIKNDASIEMGERLQYILNRFTDLIETHKPKVLVVEAVTRVYGGKTDEERNASSWTLHWVYGEIIRLGFVYNIPVNVISPSTMKAAVTEGKRSPDSKGQASKSEVKRVVQELYGQKSMRTDESDAIGLAIAYWKIYNGEYVVGAKKKKKKK